MHRQRQRPNIVLCGTPGTGKSTIAGQVSEKTGMRHVDVSEWAKSNQCLDGWDDARNCAILDEDKVSHPTSIYSSIFAVHIQRSMIDHRSSPIGQ